MLSSSWTDGGQGPAEGDQPVLCAPGPAGSPVGSMRDQSGERRLTFVWTKCGRVFSPGPGPGPGSSHGSILPVCSCGRRFTLWWDQCLKWPHTGNINESLSPWQHSPRFMAFLFRFDIDHHIFCDEETMSSSSSFLFHVFLQMMSDDNKNTDILLNTFLILGTFFIQTRVFTRETETSRLKS